MKEKRFVLAFLGIFLLVLVVVLVIFLMFTSGGADDIFRPALWSALTILVLLFGVIVISLFINRDRHKKKPL